jgi:transposase
MLDQTMVPKGPGSPERSGGERSEQPRSAGGPGRAPAHAPSNEVEARPRRRRFSNDYKLRIVREADACKESGDVGALLRREGLYSSHLTNWRKLRDEGGLVGTKPRQRGPKAKTANPLQGEVDRLNRLNVRLETELKQARAIIDVQKKVAALFATPATTERLDGEPS